MSMITSEKVPQTLLLVIQVTFEKPNSKNKKKGRGGKALSMSY